MINLYTSLITYSYIMPPIIPMDIEVKPIGCMCPLNIVQIISYIVFGFDGFCFYFITVVAWSKSIVLVWLLAVLYTILFILVSIFALLVSFSDPTDPIVYKERLMQLNGLSLF